MRRLLLICVLAGGGAFATVASAAIGLTATPASVTVPAITLNGDDQTASWNETIAVSGESQALGYNVTAWAPLPASGSNTLGALRVDTAPALTCTQGSCTTGTNSVTTYPVVLGTTSGSATKIFGATVNTANKNQQAIVTFTIPVNADRFPGTYTTTVTVTVANGP